MFFFDKPHMHDPHFYLLLFPVLPSTLKFSLYLPQHYYNVVHSNNLLVVPNMYRKNDMKLMISFFAQNDKDTEKLTFEAAHQIHIKQQYPQKLFLLCIFSS